MEGRVECLKSCKGCLGVACGIDGAWGGSWCICWSFALLMRAIRGIMAVE